MGSASQKEVSDKPDGIFVWSPYVKRAMLDARSALGIQSGTVIAWDACHNKDYHIDSFLCVDDDSLALWAAEQHKILELTQGRVIKYSKLNDRVRWKGLIPLLQAAFRLRGVCVTVAIERTAINAWVNDAGKLLTPILKTNFNHSWKYSCLWKATVVVDNVNLLLDTFFLNKGRKFVCFDNDDDIWGNENQKKDFGNMMSHWKSHTGSANRDTVNLTFDKFDPLGTSLTAIPDLVAGTVASILNGLCNLDRVEGLTSVASLPNKARIIGDWIWTEPMSLHHVIICVDRHEGGIQTYKLGNPFYQPEHQT